MQNQKVLPPFQPSSSLFEALYLFVNLMYNCFFLVLKIIKTGIFINIFSEAQSQLEVVNDHVLL